MKKHLMRFLRQVWRGPFAPLFHVAWNISIWLQYSYLIAKWRLLNAPKPTLEQQEIVCEKVTFLFKSFERQSMAKRLYKNIQSYYPGVQVIIADDSRKPLKLSGPGLKIIQLPFNSGLSYGLNCGLKHVQSEFTIRLDDDELLTPYSNFHKQVEFLISHPEVDLVGILPREFPIFREWRRKAETYYAFPMSNAPIALKIPHKTRIDSSHIVLGKVPNIFIARTDKYREVGYDDNIRMIDHHEFFFRAAGRLVSVLDPNCYVLHNHNPFNRKYQKYRMDVQNDTTYIRKKHAATHLPEKTESSSVN